VCTDKTKCMCVLHVCTDKTKCMCVLHVCVFRVSAVRCHAKGHVQVRYRRDCAHRACVPQTRGPGLASHRVEAQGRVPAHTRVRRRLMCTHISHTHPTQAHMYAYRTCVRRPTRTHALSTIVHRRAWRTTCVEHYCAPTCLAHNLCTSQITRYIGCVP
jgi:hypothetical protein